MTMRAIVISASSDIGAALAHAWSERGWKLYGTYRTLSPQVVALQEVMQLTRCDLADVRSLEEAARWLRAVCPGWDVLVFAPGSLEPVGDFAVVDFDAWERGFQVNCLRPLRLLHRLLPSCNAQKNPAVLFFAGGGTNGAVLHYSSYTLSKIALIKMCELLDAEMPDVRFAIVGPGYVQTKIHEPTFRVGATMAKTSYQKTIDKLKRGECTPMQQVVDCCTWLASTSCDAVSGRNFAAAHDAWGSKELEKVLTKDPHMYKLRRSANSWSLLSN